MATGFRGREGCTKLLATGGLELDSNDMAGFGGRDGWRDMRGETTDGSERIDPVDDSTKVDDGESDSLSFATDVLAMSACAFTGTSSAMVTD